MIKALISKNPPKNSTNNSELVCNENVLQCNEIDGVLPYKKRRAKLRERERIIDHAPR